MNSLPLQFRVAKMEGAKTKREDFCFKECIKYEELDNQLSNTQLSCLNHCYKKYVKAVKLTQS